jgi:hypothetical protein
VDETLALYRQGLTPAQIAERRGLVEGTIYGHLARLIDQGEVTLERVVSADVIAQVRAVVEETGADYLSPIKQRLPDTISYGEISCVIAGLGLAKDSSQAESASSNRSPGPKGTVNAEAEVYDEALFEVLRQWRTAQAREQGVAPFVIFHDRVLRAVAASLPADPEALRAIPGVGPAKLEQYGHTLLAIVQAHLADTSRVAPPPSSGSEPKAAPASDRQEPIDIILAAVADLSGLLSRSGLAKLLTGSPSERVAPYRDHSLYGALHDAWGRKQLTAEIDRLIVEEYLVDRRGRLVLAPAGQARLQKGQHP